MSAWRMMFFCFFVFCLFYGLFRSLCSLDRQSFQYIRHPGQVPLWREKIDWKNIYREFIGFYREQKTTITGEGHLFNFFPPGKLSRTPRGGFHRGTWSGCYKPVNLCVNPCLLKSVTLRIFDSVIGWNCRSCIFSKWFNSPICTNQTTPLF